MNKITSFQVDHRNIVPGMYVSRIDGDITTFDLRVKKPNAGDYMSHLEMHTTEHMIATFIRNSSIAGNIIYFGPMGCRTGFYLLLAGDYSSQDIIPLLTEMFVFIRDFKDEVPGACARDCGNYLDMNLPMANYLAARFLSQVLTDITEDRLVYPE